MSQPTRLNRFAPIFPVADLQRALAHYGSLGFATFAYEGGDDYGFAERDGVGPHLSAAHDREPHADRGEAHPFLGVLAVRRGCEEPGPSAGARPGPPGVMSSASPPGCRPGGVGNNSG